VPVKKTTHGVILINSAERVNIHYFKLKKDNQQQGGVVSVCNNRYAVNIRKRQQAVAARGTEILTNN
jgi:hypothetical protein